MERVIVGKHTFKNVQQMIDILDFNVRGIRYLFLGMTIGWGNNLTIRLEKPYKAITRIYTAHDVIADKTQREITLIVETEENQCLELNGEKLIPALLELYEEST